MSKIINAWNAYGLSRSQVGADFDSFKAAWLSSRAAALEEARTVVERAILDWSATNAGDLGSGPAAVAAIRALAGRGA